MTFITRIEGEEIRFPYDESSFVAGRASCRFEEQVDKMTIADIPVGTRRFVTISAPIFIGLNRFFVAYARARNVSVTKRVDREPEIRAGGNVTLVLTKRRPGYFDPLTEKDD